MTPFDLRDGTMWYNGAEVAWREARLHSMSHGLHYASCVFEGIRVYERRPYKIREHYQRFHDSAQALDFTIPYSIEKLVEASETLVRNSQLRDAYIRPFAWRGSEQMAIAADKTSIHTAIACWAFGEYFGARLKGIRLTLAKWKRPSSECAPCKTKAAGLYMICTLAKHDAQRKGYDDALMLDYRGYIAESTGANIFLLIEGKLHTPKPDCFLDGITRQTIIQIAQKQGLETIERHIPLQDLSRATEVFLTGTAAEVTAVRQIDQHTFQIGRTTKNLAAAYDKEVRGQE